MDYIKPVIVDIEDMAEGVYASGSGDADCWSLSYSCPQAWNGQAKVYEIKASHTKGVYHESTGSIITLYFDRSITSAYTENSSNFTVENYGNYVKITRNLFADAFYSGDEVTFKLFVACESKETTESVNIVNSSISCIHN